TRLSLATLLGMKPEQVRLIWTEGSGCYGQNGSDDVSADAALLSQLAGKPVRVLWSRRDEHLWEPKGTAMTMRVRAGLDAAGNVAGWNYEVWSPNHALRPFYGMAGNMLAGDETGMPAKYLQAGADRNAKATYVFPANKTTLHLVERSPVRSSSLRGLGSPQNTFANESFIDELAALAGADAIDYRIRHLKDERAIEVLRAVRDLAQWETRASGTRRSGAGRGVGFVHYDNVSAYAAVSMDVKVDAATGAIRVQRVCVAHDCGLIINPDGVRNQIEGNVIQTLSRALYEEVRSNATGLESIDWASYPILRFADLPDEIAIRLIDRPTVRAVGAGEPAASPIFAALANAVFDATGARLRTVPFTPERLKAALAGRPAAA
ncbi:MAG: molybdopterin-dependent oxidoreductase, partial [Betaproteobacteria bacterium]|nr:molybdopterin-dependent oxidoreductase [Betaproteobacteria bacterium]